MAAAAVEGIARNPGDFGGRIEDCGCGARLLALFIVGCAPHLGDVSAGALEVRCATG